MARNKGTELSVFKGREAKLNRAIFQTLALKGPQTIYDIHKQVRVKRSLRHVRYASVNKRVRTLEETGYIKRIQVRKTRAGFVSSIYEITARAYLVILLDPVGLDNLINLLSETETLLMLADVLEILRPKNS